VYAVIRDRPFTGPGPGALVPGDYMIVFASAHMLTVDSGGITYIHFPCDARAPDRVRNRTQFLLPPR
jgi:hypothetical protein